MAPFLRKVKTASGATAVQVVAKEGRRNRVLEHLGSAHSEAELVVALMHLGRERLHVGQEALDLDLTSDAAPAAGVLTMQDKTDAADICWKPSSRRGTGSVSRSSMMRPSSSSSPRD